MRRIDHRVVKTIPIRRVLEEMYGVRLAEKMVSGDLKLQGYCPICHSDKSPNPQENQFQATIQGIKSPGTTNSWKCFSDCKGKGSIIDFVMAKDQVTFRKALEMLHDRFLNGHVKPPTPPTKAVVERSPVETAPGMSNKTWLEVWGSPPKYHKFFKPCPYLESRGIRREVLEEFGVGYYENPKSKSPLNQHIVFPIHNQEGELVAYAWRTTSDEGQRYCFPPGERFNKSLELWNFHRAKEKEHVWVCEGFFSCMNLYQHGYNVVALMGSILFDPQAELLTSFRSVTLVIDPDDAGLKVATKAIEKLRGRTLLKLIFPSKQVDQMNSEEISDLLK